MDEEWKLIQQKTFTRWCNEHLRHQGMIIDDLEVDFSDGLRLIALLEVLSQKKMKRFNKRPNVRAQKMENVQLALDFIAYEKIKLVNIGAADIVDSNLKLILGLVWTLILHYQISMGFGLHDAAEKSQSPKQVLLQYLNDNVTIPGRPIKNFTTDWNDGTMIAALVDATAPGLCPEYATMDPQNALENASHAMKLADDWLGVPQVLQPEDMVNPKVDELSMMTYLSMFPEAKLKEGAPIKASVADASKVKAYGPGLEPDGLSTDSARTEFTVDVKEAGMGKLFVSLTTPGGDQEIFVDDKKDGTFTCSYLLDLPGQYVITILWAGQAIPGSPFPVNVAQGSDATACDAYGPGLEARDLKEGTDTEFWVETAGAGEGTLSLSIRGPKGPINEDVRVEDEGNGKYHVFYTPPSAGQYIIDILFGGLHIAESPYKVHIAQDRADASKCRAEGDGITGKGLEVGKRSYFWVYTQGAGRGDLSIHIRGESGTVPVECTQKEGGVYECSYLPEEDGEFVITIKYGGENIPGSRFKVTVEPPTDASKCVASGPGLEAQGVRVSIPTKFQVRTKEAGRGELEVDIIGPDNLSLAYECQSTPYVYDYTYEAKVPGMYKAGIQFAGQHVPGSPFPVAVTDTNKVSITGPGMNGEFLPINEPLEYFVDARGAGPGKVGCSVQGPMRPEDYDQSAMSVQDNEDGTFQITYTPMEAGRLKMNATFAESAIPETPIKLYVYDASQVFAEGKGLEDGNVSGELTTFTVDMRKGGEGHLHVGIDGPANTPVTVKDQANNVVNCEYIPLVAGDYDINILWEGVHIPNSPYHLSVKPSVDPSAVRVYGESLEPGQLFTDMWAEFFVDYKKAGKGQLEVKVSGPGGGEELECTEVEDGLSKFRFYVDPEEAGEYKVAVLFADQEVPGSPFILQAAWKTDPTKVKVYGTGLEGGSTHQWAEFTLDRSKAGAGDLSLSIEGPCESEVRVDDQGEGIAEVKFLPEEPGEYKVHIKFGDEAIPGSPFTPVFEPCTDASKVKAEGPGLERHGVRVGDPADFMVDTTYAGPGALDVFIEGPANEKEATVFPTIETASPRETPSPVGGRAKRKSDSLKSSARAHITNNNDDTYNVQYTAKKVGQHSISVTYDGVDIPESPFLVEVTDPSKVRMSGPGLLEEAVYTVAEPLVYAVDTTGAGNGELDITIDGPEGCNKEASIEQTADANYAVRFTPDKPGIYFIHAKLSGADLPSSPVRLGVFDADQVVVSGDCFSGAPVKVGTVLPFAVDASKAGEGELGLSLSGPSKLELAPQKQDDAGLHFYFAPENPGDYVLDATFGGKAIRDSPFTIKAYDPAKVTASGPGITGEGARVGEPAPVVVDTSKAGSAPLSASVQTPSGEVVPLELQPQPEEGVYSGDYVPDEPGMYEVEITFGDEPIAEFPYRVNVGNPTAVKYKPMEVDEEVMAEWVDGVESAPDTLPLFATVGQPCMMDVHTGNAGPGKLGAQFKPIAGSLEGEGDIPVDVEFVETDTNQYQLMFTPLTPTDMDLQVLFNGFPVGEPQRVIVSNPAACRAHGPGLESGLVANQPTHFTVETKNAGPGKLACTIHDAEKEEVPFEMEAVGESEYKVTYTPPAAGNYSVSVTYAKGPIEDSPFVFNVCDPTAVRAYGAGLEAAIVNEVAEFTVDLSKAGDGPLGLAVEGPKKTAVQCDDNGDGTFTVAYTPVVAGVYTFTIRFADMEVPASPFSVRVERPPPDASKCTVQGIDTPGSFVLDASEAGGNGILEVCAYGAFMPVQYITVTHNGDYTFDVKYHIAEPGDTTISVKWHGVHIPGSPFIVHT